MGENGFLPYLMFFGGLILLIWILMRRNWRGQAKAKKERGKDSYLVSNPRPVTKEWTMSGGPAELNKWQVEMLERTRELQAEVDTKLLILQRTLLKIEAASLPAQDHDAVQQTVSESRQLVDQGPPNFSAVSELLCDDVKRAEIYALADEGHTQAEIAQQLNLDPYAVEMIINLRDA